MNEHAELTICIPQADSAQSRHPTLCFDAAVAARIADFRRERKIPFKPNLHNAG